jgi:ABC-2 type transport system permease protein
VIGRVALKEFTEIRRDGRFLWAASIIVVLLVVAIGFGAQRYNEDRNLRTLAEQQDREAWLAQGAKNPHSAGHYGIYAFKPSTPLALFDPGYDDYTGVLQYLEAHKENKAGYRPAADATSLERFGSLSGARIMQLLIPILIFLIGFSMVAGEREEGTLKQILSMGVSQRRVICGKALGLALAIGMVLVPALLIGGCAAWLVGGAEASDLAGFLPKLALLSICYLLFFVTLIAISLLVSLLSKSSSSALVVLISLWIFGAILLPRVGADLATRIYPTPSNFEVASAIARDMEGSPHAHEPSHPNHIAFRDRLLAEHGVDRIEDLPFNFIGYAMQKEEEFGFDVYDRHYGDVRQRFERQDRVQDLLSLLSPFQAIKSLSAALAGTDVDYSQDFSAAGEAHRRKMIEILNDDVMHNAVGRTSFSTEWGYQATPDLWARIPAFEFVSPGLAKIVERNVISLVTLLTWFLASIVLLYWLARRHKQYL